MLERQLVETMELSANGGDVNVKEGLQSSISTSSQSKGSYNGFHTNGRNQKANHRKRVFSSEALALLFERALIAAYKPQGNKV